MKDLPQTMAMQQLQGSGAGQMSDLVRRLRAWHSRQAVVGDVKLYLDAADRIEELEAQLRADTDLFKRTAARIAALEAALREIAADDDGPITMAKIARAALAPEQDKMSGTEQPIHVTWLDADYNRARDCMIGLLRGHGWTIVQGRRDQQEFDNAFQHAVSILALNARSPDPQNDILDGIREVRAALAPEQDK